MSRCCDCGAEMEPTPMLMPEGFGIRLLFYSMPLREHLKSIVKTPRQRGWICDQEKRKENLKIETFAMGFLKWILRNLIARFSLIPCFRDESIPHAIKFRDFRG
ncbi:CLUMA_CG019841, isoform A [Clunio marinus]|uniref:CLUMA_CG019841, isoform A n=1 Tax=Clunio marinus TaxID=568069 RepID=A0A1J1J3V3_9DIPT|nr:CLUMA_CG019841, isoform A [Clunio marinus]